jgi:hypothetical protein
VKGHSERRARVVRHCLAIVLPLLLVVPAIATGASMAPQQVIWAELVNASAVPGALRKAGGCDGCADAGATSAQRLTGGDGYVEFSARETEAVRYVGLTDETAGINPDRFAFAIRLQAGHAEVREHGVYRADVGFVRGDVFRIAVESGMTSYWKNGVPFYRSRVAPSFPLVVSASLLGRNSSISNVVINVVIVSGGRDDPQGGR